MSDNVTITIGNMESYTCGDFPGWTFFPLIRVTWANQRRVDGAFHLRKEFHMVIGGDHDKDFFTGSGVDKLKVAGSNIVNDGGAALDFVAPNHFALHLLHLLFAAILPRRLVSVKSTKATA